MCAHCITGWGQSKPVYNDKHLKVLFVSSGNSKAFNIAPFIKKQGESLIKIGIDVQFFTVKGKGLPGYITEAFQLRRILKRIRPDIIHAHYTLSGWTAVLAASKLPVVLSLMGTDAYGEYIGVNKVKFSSRYLSLLTYLIQPLVNAIICKSKHIGTYVYLKRKSHVIPNGIELERISDKQGGDRNELGLDPEKKYVLFLGNKNNLRKNFRLLEKAFCLVDTDDSVLIAPYPVSHETVVKYLNSVDVLVVPSLMEGSPNLVKEAMACNCPVVATFVGDVPWLFGDEPGHYLAGFTPKDVAAKISQALAFSETRGRTQGRKRLIDLGLDSTSVAEKLAGVYLDVLTKTQAKKLSRG